MTENNSNSLLGWWKKVMFENYANFNGRARRAEYWYFTLGNFIIMFGLYSLGLVAAFMSLLTVFYIAMGLYGLYALASLIPSLAVAVRRLHDINRSGWYILIGLIPLVGGIILLVWAFTDGDRFVNKYGDDPKNPAALTFDFEQTQPN